MEIIYQQFSLPILAASIAIILIVVACYKYGIRPYLQLQNKYTQLKDKYSIYRYPYRPMGFSYMQKFITDFKQHGDSMHVRKHDFAEADLALGTIKDRLLIILMKQNLVQEFIEKQKEGYYLKTNGGVHFLSLKQLLGDGLLLSQAEEWKYKRKIMSALFNYELIKSKFPQIVSISKEICESAKTGQKVENKILVDVNGLFQKIFGNVVIRCFFGSIQLEPIRDKNVFQFLAGLLDKIAKRNLTITSFLFGKIMMKYSLRATDRQIKEDIFIFREYAKSTIDRIIQLVKSDDTVRESEGLIVKLIRQNKLVQDCPYDQKIKKGVYTYLDVINEICTFFFAGTDTTSNAMTSLMHELLQNKDVEEKIRAEIKDVLKDDINNLSLQNLKKMNYLKYAQSEILRVMTPVPHLIMRQASHDHKIGDIFIKKGTFVNMDIIANHHRADIFDDPYKFKPERWEKLQSSSDIFQHYFPFSAGLRICIGQQLSLIEAKVAIIILLLSFKNGKAVDSLQYKFNMTYGPESSRILFEAL